MDKKVKIINPNSYNVGIVYLNGMEKNIPPRSFALATEDDIAYLATTTSLFTGKHLTFQDEEVADNIGMSVEDLKIDTDDEIVKKISTGSLVNMRKYLESVEEMHVKKRICSIAKKADLKASRVKLIEEVFGMELE